MSRTLACKEPPKLKCGFQNKRLKTSPNCQNPPKLYIFVIIIFCLHKTVIICLTEYYGKGKENVNSVLGTNVKILFPTKKRCPCLSVFKREKKFW